MTVRPFIRPIETAYKGYRFRSRLEARWAVFFSKCGFNWYYENEGYETPYGRWLPDFHITGSIPANIESLIEVKPSHWSPTSEEENRMKAASDQLNIPFFCCLRRPTRLRAFVSLSE